MTTTTTDENLYAPARTCRITAGSDHAGHEFGGVAVAAGDILHVENDGDVERVLMTADELRKAASTQEGEPLTTDHPEDDSGRPQYPPPVDETVGKVVRAGWLEDQQAVGYKATTHDDAIAQGVKGGSYSVSVHAVFDFGEYSDEHNAWIATNIEFLDLSVVSKGDSPSATAEWDSPVAEALADWTDTADFDAELSAGDKESIVQRTVRATLNKLGIDGDDGDVEAHLDDDSVEVQADETDGDFEQDEEVQAMVILTDDEMEVIREALGNAVEAHREPLREDIAEELSGEYSEEQVEQLMEKFAPVMENVMTSLADEMVMALKPDEEKKAEKKDESKPDESGDEFEVDETKDDGMADADEVEAEEGEETEDDDGETLADMEVDDLVHRLEEAGFVTEDQADEVVAEAEEQKEKSEKVDEIIAHSDRYSENDRGELMASSMSLVESEYQKVRAVSSARIPVTAGADRSQNDDEDDLDAYGTGVSDK